MQEPVHLTLGSATQGAVACLEGFDPSADRIGRHWLAEEIALRLRAALPANQIELPLGFHALGRRHHPEALAQADHRFHYPFRILPLARVATEPPIELDTFR